jgi:methylated-DNA-protein-cysteine methyltransferase-like protein
MKDWDKESLRQGIYDIVKYIPRGRATSYGAVAKAAGYPNLSRMVGKIMSGCSEKKIPAHRVVNSQGVLSGKDAFGSAGEMQKLLEAEGVVVKNDRIINWKTIFWNPLEEIKME